MGKMNTSLPFVVLGFVLVLGQSAFAQKDHTIAQEKTFKNFRAALLLGHTSVPRGEHPNHLFVPSWGADFEYWFNHKWGLGLHNDIELQTFVVEKAQDETLEREYPLVTTLDLLFKPVGDLVVLIGPGYEIEKNENLALLRFGIEYEFEIPGDWDISPTIFYDTRADAFDTWSIALGIGKRF